MNDCKNWDGTLYKINSLRSGIHFFFFIFKLVYIQTATNDDFVRVMKSYTEVDFLLARHMLFQIAQRFRCCYRYP